MSQTLTERLSPVVQFSGHGDDAPLPKMHFAASTKSEGQEALHVSSRPIFRSGTFRDSAGEESTWDKSHIDQMVFHFGMLRDTGVLRDIPVRAYHPDTGGIFSGSSRNPMDELIGYITDLRSEERTNPVDGNAYSYLVADYEILDDTAKQKISSGLWRNLSAEVGGHRSNNNAEYYPVLRGVAYVDFSAVEGLNSFSEGTQEFKLITEESMTAFSGGPTTGLKNNQPAPPTDAQEKKSGDTDVHKTSEHAASTPQGGTDTATSGGGASYFTVNGQTVSNHAEVQAILDEVVQLREFREATESNAREQFVDKMISEGRFTAPQRDSAIEYAKSLSAKQFSAWRELQSNAPVVSLLDNHSPSGNNEYTYNGEEGAQLTEKEHRIEVLSGMVHTHSLSGMPKEKIEQLGSYKELIALDPNFTL